MVTGGKNVLPFFSWRRCRGNRPQQEPREPAHPGIAYSRSWGERLSSSRCLWQEKRDRKGTPCLFMEILGEICLPQKDSHLGLSL